VSPSSPVAHGTSSPSCAPTIALASETTSAADTTIAEKVTRMVRRLQEEGRVTVVCMLQCGLTCRVKL
jgi:ABC-type dipeptide/oligopeptide/nickel transport system ATPase component